MSEPTDKQWNELLAAAREVMGDVLRSDCTYEAVRRDALDRLREIINVIEKETYDD